MWVAGLGSARPVRGRGHNVTDADVVARAEQTAGLRWPLEAVFVDQEGVVAGREAVASTDLREGEAEADPVTTTTLGRPATGSVSLLPIGGVQP